MKVNIGKYSSKFDNKRKISVQVDNYDTWNLDHTLALIIHPALIKFKEDSQKIGHPCLGSDDVELCTSGKCGCGDKWQEILDKMIWSFGEIISDSFDKFDTIDFIEYDKKLQEGLDLFGKYFRSLWT